MCNTCVTMFLQKRSICLSIRDPKLERCAYKNIGSSHLKETRNLTLCACGNSFRTSHFLRGRLQSACMFLRDRSEPF